MASQAPPQVGVQAAARDAVRVPLPTVPKRVVNFRDSEEAPPGEAATTTALRPAKATVYV